MDTAYQRKLDELGRVVLPQELRRLVDLNECDTVRITVEQGRVILEKVEQTS